MTSPLTSPAPEIRSKLFTAYEAAEEALIAAVRVKDDTELVAYVARVAVNAAQRRRDDALKALNDALNKAGAR